MRRGQSGSHDRQLKTIRTSSVGSLGLPKSAHADATLWQFLDGYEATDLEERAKLVCGGRWPVDQ
jgi:hypothetical protein